MKTSSGYVGGESGIYYYRSGNVRDLEQEITCTLSPMENQVLDYYLYGQNGYTEIAKIMGKTSIS